VSWDSHTGIVVLPFAVGLLLVGIVIVGSRLQPARKRQVETFFLLPSFVLLAVSMMVFAAVWEHNWIRFAVFAVVTLIGVWRLLEHRRGATR